MELKEMLALGALYSGFPVVLYIVILTADEIFSNDISNRIQPFKPQ